jgi:type I restriction enzyme S subunit
MTMSNQGDESHSKYDRLPFTELLSTIIDNRGKTCPTAESGIPLIATNCIRNDSLYPLHEKVRYVDRDTYETWFRGHPIPGDLIFVTKGTPGRVCMTPDPVGFCIAQDMVAVRADKSKIDPNYLLAALRSRDVQRQIENMHVGTLIPHFKKGDFDKLLIAVPDRTSQEHIGSIYRTLSDKIELNRRMNATLEAMARALFQSWFVDFDPVRAKLDGRQPAGMDAATAALFPASFRETHTSHIPSGWSAARITECCERIHSGGTPKRDESRYWIDGTIPWLTSGEVRQPMIIATDNSITELGLNESAAKWVPEKSTVVALYGATAGQVSFLATSATTNQAVCALVPKAGFAFFNYFAMRAATPEMENKAVGSAQQNISKGIIEETRIVMPPASILTCFNRQAGPLFNSWVSCHQQSRTLADLRDTLLPKLLSGELRIKEAEGVVGKHP